MFVAALFGHEGIPVHPFRFLGNFIPFGPVDLYPLGRKEGNFPILHKNEVSCIRENRRNIRSNEIFVFAQANHKGGLISCTDQTRFIPFVEDSQGIRPLILSMVILTASRKECPSWMNSSTRWATISVSVSELKTWPFFLRNSLRGR